MKTQWNLPNSISIFRLCLVAVFVTVFFRVSARVSAIVMLVAAASDMLDGFIARKYHKITPLGKILDPLADKLLMGAVCICIGIKYHVILLPLLFILKEVFMILGSYLLIRAGKEVAPAQWYGKLAVVMFFICSLSILLFVKSDEIIKVVVLLSVAALFILFAFVMYVKLYVNIICSREAK